MKKTKKLTISKCYKNFVKLPTLQYVHLVAYNQGFLQSILDMNRKNKNQIKKIPKYEEI